MIASATGLNTSHIYRIKIVIADGGANTGYDSAIFLGGGSFDSTTEIGPDRLIATGNPICNDETFTLNATTTNALGYQWYRNGEILSGETNPTSAVLDGAITSTDTTITLNSVVSADRRVLVYVFTRRGAAVQGDGPAGEARHVRSAHAAHPSVPA